MRWVLRHLFTILSAISLLLCVGTCVLWVRSWRYGESMERVSSDRRYMATSMAGLITATRWDGPFEPGVAMEFDGRAPPGTWERWKHWRQVSRFPGTAGPSDFAYQCSFTGPDTQWWEEFGFDYGEYWRKPRPNAIPLHDWILGTWSGRVRSLTLPYWALAVAFLVLPSFAAIRTIRRMMRARIGCCPNCGYDLRASADRCPECGTAVARVALNS